MKFASTIDLNLFLIEIGLSDKVNTDVDITENMISDFIKGRRNLFSGIRDFRKSQSTKKGWRSNRYKILKGIRAFHKSTKGKRFHRNLGRFLATRLTYKHNRINNTDRKIVEQLTVYDKSEFMKSISSTKTHLYIELEYFHPLMEQVELEELLLYLIPNLNRIENKVIADKLLLEEDYDLIIRITENEAIIKSFADKYNKTVSEVEKLWKEIENKLIEEGKSIEDKNFYAILVTILKEKLK